MRISHSFLTPLTRRQFVLSGAAACAAFAFPSFGEACALAPEQEQGPFYIDGAALRPDITEGKSGAPLRLRIGLVDAKRCSPLAGAAIDIWHCDAVGVYSGFTANGGGPAGMGPGGPHGVEGTPAGGPPPVPPPGGGFRGARGDRGGPPPARITDATRFLRGVQISNSQGLVEFQTLYPGWYAGRTIHVHVKVHVGGAAAANGYSGGRVSHTGQLFFPEDITEQIAKLDPYARHTNVRRTLQNDDGVFRGQNGAQSMVRLERQSSGSDKNGFIASISLAVDPEAVPARVGVGG